MSSSVGQFGTLGVNKFAHSFAETSDERAFRQTANFPDLETSMSFPLFGHRNSSFLDMGFSILGKWNPFSWHPFVKTVDNERHEVWLLDNTAFRTTKDGPWQAKFTAAYFEKNTGEHVSEAVGTIARILGIADDAAERDTIETRLEPFLTTILPAHQATIKLCGKDARKLSPSNFDGISRDEFRVPGDFKDGETCESVVANLSSSIACTTTFAETSGWAVISDIDDTIKITGTGDPKLVLQNTFVEEPQVVPGMPDLYKWLETKLDNPPFWYLSASPYVLYPFLRNFRKKNYPDGTMQLRETSLMNIAALLTSLTMGVQKFKTEHIESIYQAFPQRKVMCFGDSTQSDPESYAEIYKKHPGWIAGIFIRKVEGLAALDIAGKNKAERFEKAFEGVPKDDWMVFTDPQDIYARVSEIMARKPE